MYILEKIKVSKLRSEILERSLYLKTTSGFTKGNNSLLSVFMAAEDLYEHLLISVHFEFRAHSTFSMTEEKKLPRSLIAPVY